MKLGMNLHVPGERASLIEFAMTDVTFVSHLLLMNSADMAVEATSCGKLLRAEVALVRSTFLVHRHNVSLEISSPGECFIARPTELVRRRLGLSHGGNSACLFHRSRLPTKG